MSKKILFIIASTILGLLAVFNACSRPRFIPIEIPTSSKGGTTVGTPMVNFKLSAYTSSSVSEFGLCIESLNLHSDTETFTVHLDKNYLNVSPEGSSIGSSPLPKGRYGLISLTLTNSCGPQNSLHLINSQGRFSSGTPLKISFKGDDFIQYSDSKVVLNLQKLINALESVGSNLALENTVGTAQLDWVLFDSKVWSSLSTLGAPTPRGDHTAVWTGSKMIVWGGWYLFETPAARDTGGIYDPATDSWEATSLQGAPSGRRYHSAVWTGSRLIIWGGENGSSSLNSGAIFNPMTNTWSTMSAAGAPSARSKHTALWTGSRMIVWGGKSSGGSKLNDGAIYDPAMDSWTPMSLAQAPSPRMNHTAVWTGSQMIVWGGCSSSSAGCSINSLGFNTGGIYDLTTDSWQATSLVNSPMDRYSHTAVWTGSRMIIWGGESLQNQSHIYLSHGAAFDPTTNSWSTISSLDEPTARTEHTAVIALGKMIVWGGIDNSNFLNSGAVYNPATDSWVRMETEGAPVARKTHSSIWTGEKFITWGGWNNTVAGPFFNDGGWY